MRKAAAKIWQAYMAKAVAAKLQRRARESQAIVDHIKCTLLVEGRARVAIGHDDLNSAGAVDDGAHTAAILIPTAAQPAVTLHTCTTTKSAAATQ
jgi:hypothetical protein